MVGPGQEIQEEAGVRDGVDGMEAFVGDEGC